MLTYQDDFTKLIMSKTLSHFHHHIDRGRLSKGGYRTFADFILGWQLMPHIDVNVAISRVDVDENGIAREIAFRWDYLNEEALNSELTRMIKSEVFEEKPYWYQLDLAQYKPGGRMVGALINHGTTTEPKWSSHT